MATVDQNSNAVLQGIARHLNCLTEENRNIRKKAIEGLRIETIDKTPPLDPESLNLVFSQIFKPLLKLLSDPVEKCRELSVAMISDFLKQVQKPDENLPYIIPVLCQRLGQQEIIETSEEVRLSSVKLLYQIMEFSGKKLSVYLDDIIRILQRTLIDPYPEVKKQSCYCSSLLAKTIPEYFHAQTESLVKPLLMSITHQHSKVRTLVIETLGDILQFGNGKYVDDVISHLAQRLFDRTPLVRKAVTKVVGNWLLDLPDRYSFHHKLIPLLLTSITDEQPEISDLADTLWHDIGIKYEGENESDLKDKMDFAAAAPSHYPENVERPNLGCRTLVMRHLSKILPGLLRDMGDWVVDTRVKSAALLRVLLLNAEDYITQHMERLGASMYKACMDEDKRVVTDVRRAAELIGYFVPPEVWCKLVLANVRLTQSSGSLMVLASVVQGSERRVLKDYISQICNVLASPEICQSIQTNVHLQLLACINAILDILQDDCVVVSQDLFTVLLTVLSQAQDPTVKQQVNTLQLKLGQAEGLGSLAEVYSKHSAALIESFQDCFGLWTVHSVERQIFDVLLVEAGPVVGELLDYIIPMLVANLNADKDPEMRLKFFALLSRLMVNAAGTLDSKQRFGRFAVTVVTDMIVPNCVWRAGRTAGAIRTTAVSCCWALLQSGVLTQAQLAPVVEELLTQIIGTMQDDHNKTTRLVSCRVMTRIFDLMGPALSRDRLHNIYPELLKRLDDSSDEIRVTVAKTFLAYFGCFESNYEPDLYRAHLEAIYRGLLVHLDDPEPKIQEAMLEVLKCAGEIVPSLLKTEVEAVKHKHRTQLYCDQLLQHLNELNTAH